MTPQIIMVAIIALAGFGSGWTIQNWRYGAKENERAQQTLVQIQASAASNIRRADNVIAAQNRANDRAVVLRRDVDSSRVELGRLRDELARSRSSLTVAACPDRAAALGDVLAECAGAYQDLAGKTDRHTSDIHTLIDAWPK